MLFDAGNRVAAEYGLRFELPGVIKDIYLNTFGLDLETENGDTSWTLPMPGSIIVGSDGLVTYGSVDPDYTVRPEPEEVLSQVRRLTG